MTSTKAAAKTATSSESWNCVHYISCTVSLHQHAQLAFPIATIINASPILDNEAFDLLGLVGETVEESKGMEGGDKTIRWRLGNDGGTNTIGGLCATNHCAAVWSTLDTTCSLV